MSRIAKKSYIIFDENNQQSCVFDTHNCAHLYIQKHQLKFSIYDDIIYYKKIRIKKNFCIYIV